MLTSDRHGVVATIGMDAMLARSISSPALVIVACALVGCGSDDGASASPDERMPAEPDAAPSVDDGAFDRGPADRRVRRVSTDTDGDGVEDSAFTYAYDDAGRIVSRTLDSAGFGTVTAVTFQYEAGLLVTKTDGTDTITYINDRGRVVAIEDSLFDERATFDYDEAGRLASFTESGPAEDDDADVPTGPDEPSVPASRTSVVIDVVRDGRGLPARFDERDGSGTVLLGRDAAGRLVSLEEYDEASAEEGLRQTLTRDGLGRVVGIDVRDRDTGFPGADGDPELTTYRIVHEANRVASIEVRRSFGLVLVEVRTALEYAADGLLERSTTVIERTDEEGTERSTEVSTYEYESPACAPQRTNDPRRALVADGFGEPRAAIAALECGYYLDDDF